MISKIVGEIIKNEGGSLIVKMGGIGLKVFVCPHTKKELEGQKKASLWTYLAMRENALELYGFKEEKELELFKILTSISGIGPKSALSILSLEDADTIKKAASAGDKTYLTKVSGIGAKSAERIIIELRDKFSAKTDEEDTGIRKEEMEILEALIAFGYNKAQAKRAIKKIPSDIRGTNNKIKEALKTFSG